jgi:hypothetical protein
MSKNVIFVLVYHRHKLLDHIHSPVVVAVKGLHFIFCFFAVYLKSCRQLILTLPVSYACVHINNIVISLISTRSKICSEYRSSGRSDSFKANATVAWGTRLQGRMNHIACSYRGRSGSGRRSEPCSGSGDALRVPVAAWRERGLSLWHSTRHSRGLPHSPQVSYIIVIN